MTRAFYIKRAGLWSTIKIGGAVGAVLGFAAGALTGSALALFSSAVGKMISEDTSRFGFTVLFFFPFAGAAVCWFVGMTVSFLVALIFNLVSGMLGGLHVEVEPEEKARYKERNR